MQARDVARVFNSKKWSWVRQVSEATGWALLQKIRSFLQRQFKSLYWIWRGNVNTCVIWRLVKVIITSSSGQKKKPNKPMTQLTFKFTISVWLCNIYSSLSYEWNKVSTLCYHLSTCDYFFRYHLTTPVAGKIRCSLKLALQKQIFWGLFAVLPCMQ